MPGTHEGSANQALRTCDSTHQATRVAQLLTSYSDVFSKDEEDVGRTDLVQHAIPVELGTTPIRQPPRRLGPEKDKEVEEQVTQLVRERPGRTRGWSLELARSPCAEKGQELEVVRGLPEAEFRYAEGRLSTAPY